MTAKTNSNPKPDAFSRHEVLHLASVLSDLFDRHLLASPAVQSDPALRHKAEAISDLLGEFYQAAGQADT